MSIQPNPWQSDKGDRDDRSDQDHFAWPAMTWVASTAIASPLAGELVVGEK